MSYKVEAVGNLGADPVQKSVTVESEEKPVVELSVRFDRRVPDGEGGYADRGGFWRKVVVWNPKLGDRVMKHLKKGAKVMVRGTERASVWVDDQDQARESYEVNADHIAVDLLCVESLTFRERSTSDQES